ncbi:precorrin-6A reductase [Guggenheimella bovis]
MNEVFLFAGTTEGRLLVEATKDFVPYRVFVVTEYAKDLLTDVRVEVGEKSEEDLRAFFSKKPALVIDATHPYARNITKTLRKLTSEYGIEYVRLKRPVDEIEGYSSYEEIVDYLRERPGNILLSTGFNSLKSFLELKDRIFLRMVPHVENIQKAFEYGLSPSQVIAMMGPFSYELNKAILKDLSIRYLVTKSSGGPGGFEEKKRAAEDAGAELIVLTPPQERGQTIEEVIDDLRSRYGSR